MARFCHTCGESNPTTQSRRQGEGQERRREAESGGWKRGFQEQTALLLAAERRELCERLEAPSKAAER